MSDPRKPQSRPPEGGGDPAVTPALDCSASEPVLAARARALSQLAGGVWHEMANPLGALMAFSAMLRLDSRVPRDLHEEAQLAADAAGRVHRLMRELTELVRIRPHAAMPVRPTTLVRGMMELEAHLLIGVDVSVEISEGLPDLLADAAAVRHALLLVTLDALAALGGRQASGSMRISGRLAGELSAPFVELVVEDSAPAVAPAAAGHLFDAPDTAGISPAGHVPSRGGQDLLVARMLLRAEGGDLRYEPSGRGANTFVLRIPAQLHPAAAVARDASARGAATRVEPDWVMAARAASDPAMAHASPPAVSLPHPGEDRPATGAGGAHPSRQAPSDGAAEDAAAAGPSPVVLVCDDEPAVLVLISRALGKAGIRTVEAATAAAALQVARREHVDVVLADQGMPGMSGMELHEALSRARPGLATRFILMTGDATPPSLPAAVQAAGARLLLKPFDLSTLLRAVREMADRQDD